MMQQTRCTRVRIIRGLNIIVRIRYNKALTAIHNPTLLSLGWHCLSPKYDFTLRLWCSAALSVKTVFHFSIYCSCTLKANVKWQEQANWYTKVLSSLIINIFQTQTSCWLHIYFVPTWYEWNNFLKCEIIMTNTLWSSVPFCTMKLKPNITVHNIMYLSTA